MIREVTPGFAGYSAAMITRVIVFAVAFSVAELAGISHGDAGARLLDALAQLEASPKRKKRGVAFSQERTCEKTKM